MDVRWVVLMRAVSRRRFLELAGGGVAATTLSDSIARALAIPANRSTRSLRDVEHIVVLTQENRSFDHYFGVMRGVRGFGDPHPAVLPSGKPVWFQAEGTTVVPPFHPSTRTGRTTWRSLFIEDSATTGTRRIRCSTAATGTSGCRPRPPHAWRTWSVRTFRFTTRWLMRSPCATATTARCSDRPIPNRYYIWTGWDGNDGKGGGPVIANDEIGYSWTTYPERLQAAGISWKIYQDIGNGLDLAGVWGFTSDPYIGNFGDNSLLYFLQYQNAKPGNPLYDRARNGTDVKDGGGLFDILAADVANDRLPSVSWIPAPQAYTEHPPFPPVMARSTRPEYSMR